MSNLSIEEAPKDSALCRWHQEQVYKAYCIKRNYLNASDYPDSYVTDEFDDISRRFIVLDEQRDACGGFRVVPYVSEKAFPALSVFTENHDILEKKGIVPTQLCEVTQFVAAQEPKKPLSKFLITDVGSFMQEHMRDHNLVGFMSLIDPLLFRLYSRYFTDMESLGQSREYNDGAVIPSITWSSLAVARNTG